MMSTLLNAALETPMTLTLVLVGLVTFLLAVRRWAGPKLPPGPRPLPLVGNLMQFEGKPQWEKFFEWSQQHGPVITVRFGPTPIVVINSLDTLTEAFVTRGNDFSNKPQLPSTAMASGQFSDIAFSNYSEVVRQRRKIAMQCLRQYLTEDQHTERVHETVQKTIKRIISDSDKSKTGTLSIGPHLFFCTINIIHSICFGTILEMDSPEFNELNEFFHFFSTVFGGLWEDTIPLLQYFPTRNFRDLKAHYVKFENYIRKQIDKEKATWKEQEASDCPNLVHRMLAAQKRLDTSEDEVMQEALTEKSLLWLVANLFFAGTDTGRTSLDWGFLIFSEKQDVQAMLRERVDEVIGSSIPSKEHRPRLGLIESALQETLRLLPPTPLGIIRETARPTQVHGYDLPAHQLVMGNLYAILHDPKHWEDPTTYRPKRFLKEDGTLIPRPPAFIPFSIGLRSCVGEFMARQTLLYVTCGLLQSLEFHLPPGAKVDYQANPDAGLLNAPKDYKVVVKRRNV